MKRLLLIVLPLLLIVGCSKPINEETLIDKNGFKFHPDTKELYSGKVYINRLGGKKEFEGTYLNGVKDGDWTQYLTDGEKSFLLTYKNGKPWNGELIEQYNDYTSIYFVYTYDNGKVLENEYYVDVLGNKLELNNKLLNNNGLYYKENSLKPYTGGVFEKFHHDGWIKLIGSYNNGLKNGKWNYWMDYRIRVKEKLLSNIGNYKNGKVIDWEIFTEPDGYESIKFNLTNSSSKSSSFSQFNRDEVIVDNTWVRIKIYGQHFFWTIHYPGLDGKFGNTHPLLIDELENPIGLDRESEHSKDDIITSNQLHIPINTNILLEMTSSLKFDGELIEDLSELDKYMDINELNHTLFIPELNLLQDVIFGEWKNIIINVDETGNWKFHCVNYCGIASHRHTGYLTIETMSEYQSWVEEQTQYLLEETVEDLWGDDDW